MMRRSDENNNKTAPQFCRNTEQTQKVMKRQNEKFVEEIQKRGRTDERSSLETQKKKKMDDSISRGGVEKTPRVLVSHKRPRSEDEAFNDDEFEDDGDFEEMNGGFSSRRRRRKPSSRFDSPA